MLLLTVLCGCRAGYVARVSCEHLRFISRAEPIAEQVSRTSDPARREKLETVLAVREFAAANGLDPGGSYAEISETEGLARAHVVTAAYKDRLEPYVWRYPVVGSMPYRGYFERADADAYAAKLDREGLDTHVVEASGYSTLGWFDDPLPSGVLELDVVGVAGFVLHELTHRRLFVSGEIDFNETLASAVSARLTEKFFAEKGDDALLKRALRRHAAWLDEAHACDALSERLEAYFAENAGRSEVADSADLMAGRAAIYAAAVPRLRAVRLLSPEGDEADINNAVLLAWRRYRSRVRDFEAYFDRYPSVDAALAALETKLAETEDPWVALGAAAGAAVAPP
jgi:predicted aminopeptidase